MELNDLTLKLFSNEPIYVDGVPIHPISVAKISDVGYGRFNTELRLLCLTIEDVNTLSEVDISDIGIYTYLVGSALHDPQLMDVLLYWFSAITHSRMFFSSKRLCFSSGAFEINKDNFDEIQLVIRHRNGLQDAQEEEDNPANEAARRILQRSKEERLKRRKAKRGGEENEISLSDLVSVLASGLKMSFEEVMKYDLCQFNDQLNRLKIFDDYEVSVQALLHGAKKEDVKITHWISKIKINQNND